MEAEKLLKSLEAKRDHLNSLIEGLQEAMKAVGANAKSQSSTKGVAKPHGRVWTPSMRAAMSRRLKASIAAKRKATEARSRARKAKATPKPKPAAKASA